MLGSPQQYWMLPLKYVAYTFGTFFIFFIVKMALQKSGLIRFLGLSAREPIVTFSVLVNNLQPFELVGLTGNTKALGDWNPDSFIKLNPTPDGIWKTSLGTTNICEDIIGYRYFIYTRQMDGNIQIRFWETHLCPRTIYLNKLPNKRLDVFGISNNDRYIHRGWLTHENVIQFKFYNNPFDLIAKNNASIYLKLTALCTCSGKIIKNPGKANIEVVQLESGECKLKPQKSIGTKIFTNSITMFHVTVSNISQVTYNFQIFSVFDFCLIGSFDVEPKTILNTDGYVEPSIISPTGKMIGTVRFPYVVIKPMSNRSFDFKNAFAYYWSDKWTQMDYGHRGCGESFNEHGENSDIVENTMASFKVAVDSKVDGIEIDVMLTKDLVPIIFHDFFITTYYGPGAPQDASDLCEIPICRLDYKELKKISWYKVKCDQILLVKAHEDEINSDCGICPTLAEFLRTIPEHIGINLEIKYPQLQINGVMEGIQCIDKNCYIDIILDELITDSGSRNIILTCFEADVTIMVRFKQNLFPVAFLSSGKTTKWIPTVDPRCGSALIAIMCAQAFELIGISALIEECMDNQKVLLKAFGLRQIVFLWGDELDNCQIIKKFKKNGVTGLIYDRINILSSRLKKTSIFNNPTDKSLYATRMK